MHWRHISYQFFLALSSAVHPLLSNFSTKAFAELVLLEWIRKEYGKKNRQIKRGYHEYQFTETVTWCKWFDQWSVTMLFSNISGMQSTSTVQRPMKGSATNIPVPCQDVIKCIIKALVAWTWSTKEHQLTILIVNL